MPNIHIIAITTALITGSPVNASMPIPVTGQAYWDAETRELTVHLDAISLAIPAPPDLYLHTRLTAGRITCSDPTAPDMGITYQPGGSGPTVDGGRIIGCESVRTFQAPLRACLHIDYQPIAECVMVTQ